MGNISGVFALSLMFYAPRETARRSRAMRNGHTRRLHAVRVHAPQKERGAQATDVNRLDVPI